MKELHEQNTFTTTSNLCVDFDRITDIFLLHRPQLFESFMENSPALAWIADEECRIYYMNRSYRQTFDLGDESLMKPPEIFPPDYLKLYKENNRKVIAENKPLETIEDGYDQHGRYRIFKVCKFPLGEHKGKALIGGWMIDLTAELKAEKELQHSNERYRYALKAISDVVWEWDVQGKSMFISEGYESVFGYKATCDINMLQLHVHPEDVKEVVTSFLSAIKGKEQYWEMQYRYKCKDGSVKHVLNKAFVVRAPNGDPQRVIGALQDITRITDLQLRLIADQDERRKQLVRVVIEAQEEERNEIGKELHDNVNQLLTTAKLLVESAQLNPQKSGEILSQTLQLLNNALQETRNLSHQLIAPSLDPEDFYDSIKDLAASLNLTGNIQVYVDLPLPEDLKNTTVEMRLSIYRIIQEQVGNIIKYARANNVLISLSQNGSEWKLEIKDDGIGFDPAKKITGIGLKNMRSRAEAHSGWFILNSSEGKGCTVLIGIPNDPLNRTDRLGWMIFGS